VGLDVIHKQDLVHQDLHAGNILNQKTEENDFIRAESLIADLGLSQPVNCQKKEGKIYGVLPYIAPEVLRGHPYTKASDIYSFGIIMYELLTNSYPYLNYLELEDIELPLEICQDLRPELEEVKMPQVCKDLIKRC
jgi:serine/threonine protein kinase